MRRSVPGSGNELRAQGRDIGDELLSHIAPGHSDNINFFGAITVDIEAELAKLVGGWRPLRAAQPVDLGCDATFNPVGSGRTRAVRALQAGER